MRISHGSSQISTCSHLSCEIPRLAYVSCHISIFEFVDRGSMPASCLREPLKLAYNDSCFYNHQAVCEALAGVNACVHPTQQFDRPWNLNQLRINTSRPSCRMCRRSRGSCGTHGPVQSLDECRRCQWCFDGTFTTRRQQVDQQCLLRGCESQL